MGQPGRGSAEREQMAAVLMRPEDQEMFGQGQPPNVYPDPPQWDPSMKQGDPNTITRYGSARNPQGYGQAFPQNHPQLPQGQPPSGGQSPNSVGRSPYGGWGQGSPQLDPVTNQYRTQPVGQPQQLDQSGQNSYAQYAYRNAGPAADPNVAQQRNTWATPISDEQNRLNWQRMYPNTPYPGPTGDPYTGRTLGGVDLSGGSEGPGGLTGRGETPGYLNVQQAPPSSASSGFNSAAAQQQWAQYYPGTPYPGDALVQQVFGAAGSGYGMGGVNNPAYTGPGAGTGSPNYNFGGDSTGYQSPFMNSPQAGGQNYTALQQAVAQSMQNGYTDITGMREYFKPGQFADQLTGFNTNGILGGGTERGENTLKNMMGTIFSNFDVRQPGALNTALPEIRKALPNATVSGPKQDLLDPDGPNGPMAPVDVIRNAAEGGAGDAWAWQPTDQPGAAGLTGGPGGPSQQAYLSGMPGQQQQQPFSMTGGPQVGDQNSAMQFLQWLMDQQRQGQLPQYSGGSPSGVPLP